MANPETFPEKNKDGQWGDPVKKRDGKDRIWAGILLLIVGGVLLARSFDVHFPDGLFSWQSLLITFGILTGIRNKFEGPSWLILILIGSAFLVNDFYFDIKLRDRLWPLIIICIGIFFLFRSRIARRGKRPDQIKGSYDNVRSSKSESSFANINIIFSGANKLHASQNFSGGNIMVIFGGAKLDLTKSDIQDIAVINFTAICGGVDLITPSDWTVKSQLTSILGFVHDSRTQNPLIPEDPKKILILQGTAVCAGIEIRSFEHGFK